MEKKNRTRGNKARPAVEKELGPLMGTIDDAVAGIRDEEQRQEVRKAVSEAVHGAIGHLLSHAEPKALAPQGFAPQSLIGDAAQAGINAARQVQELGFVEFTTGLINGTFDAIIDATIRQMKAYAELVADLAKTLTQFKEENVTDADVTAHLTTNYPDGLGGTSIRPSYHFKQSAADPDNGIPAETAKEKLRKVAEALARETSGLPETHRLVFNELTDASGSDTDATLSNDFVQRARTAVGKLLAKSMIEHLRAMASEGMARIVISDGELLSKLTFRVMSTEVESTQTSNYRERRFGLNASARFSSRRFGASLGIGYGSVNVSAVNTQSFDALTMSTEIIGQVKLHFRTESFTPVVKDTPIV